MNQIEALDLVVAAVLSIAALRGLFLGLVREAFSLASLCAAYLAVKLGVARVAPLVESAADGRIDEAAAPWVAGALLAVGAIAVVVIAGRVVRRGVRAAGLSWADRIGGGVLGVAEGAVVAAILVAVAGTVLGRDHPAIAPTRSLAALEQAEHLARGTTPPDVAAPPRS